MWSILGLLIFIAYLVIGFKDINFLWLIVPIVLSIPAYYGVKAENSNTVAGKHWSGAILLMINDLQTNRLKGLLATTFGSIMTSAIGYGIGKLVALPFS